MDVLAYVGLACRDTAALVPREKEFYAVEDPLIQNSGVVVLHRNPLILRAFLGSFAIGVDVIDVIANIPRVGEHRAYGRRSPLLSSLRGDTSLVHVLCDIEK